MAPTFRHATPVSYIHRMFSARYAFELACVLTAVIAAILPLHGLSKALMASETMVLFLLYGASFTFSTLWLHSDLISPTTSRLRTLKRSTKTWGLAGGGATLIAVAALDVPSFSVSLIVLYGWILFALLALLNPDTIRRRGNYSQNLANHMEKGAAAKASFELARPGMRLRRRKPAGRLAKRSIDLLGSALGIVILLPMLIASMLAIKLTSKGPILFRQPRIGENGNVFICLKFRTMTLGAQDQLHRLRESSTQDGPAFKMPNDPRITPVGHHLRKYSLDELPQLFNVLIGNMSLVGPRPSVPSEVEEYEPWQLRRVTIKPGLTCIWQVWGRNEVSFKRWMEMDLEYIDNWSIWVDLKLIAHTIPAMVKGTGM